MKPLEFDHFLPLAKPAASTWCQGPVPSPRGSQEPATVPWVRLKALGVGRRVWGSAVFGRPETKRRLERPHSYTSLRVAPSLALRIHFWKLLQPRGDVELNPGPILRGAPWNLGGLTQAKRIPLEKWLKEERAAWSVLVETHFSAPECETFTPPSVCYSFVVSLLSSQARGGEGEWLFTEEAQSLLGRSWNQRNLSPFKAARRCGSKSLHGRIG